MLEGLKYEIFRREREKETRALKKKAQRDGDIAFNKGLWDAVKWRNPLAYFVLKLNIR